MKFSGSLTPAADGHSFLLRIYRSNDAGLQYSDKIVAIPRDQFFARAQEHFDRLIRAMEEEVNRG